MKDNKKQKIQGKRPGKQTLSTVDKSKRDYSHLFAPIIFIFSFLLYSNTLNHGFVMDDGAVITDNLAVQKGIGGIVELFHQSSVYGSTKENFGTYRPLTMMLFAIEWHFFKDNSSPYHIIHVILFSLCCVVVFFTLKKLLRGFHPLLPFVATLLFAAHPIHTEVGANIKSADEIFSLMFCFTSLYFALLYSEINRAANAIASLLFFTAALFSKENSITFLVIIPLAIILFRKENWKKQVPVLVTLYFVSCLFYLFIRHAVLEKAPETISIVNNSLTAAQSWNERYATIFYILLYYVRLLILPHPLSWDYSFNQIPLVSFANIIAIISILLYLSLLVFCLIFFVGYVTNGKQETTNKKLIVFCILFYLITLAPVSNIFVPIAATMAERFLFLPSVAFCVLVSYFLFLFIQATNKKPETILAMILLPILLLYSAATINRNKDWKSNYTLFAAGVQTSPDSYRTHSSFAWEALKEGQKQETRSKKQELLQQAKTHYEQAVSIYGRTADDFYNLGVTDYDLGDIAAAMEAYQHAIAVKSLHRNASYNLASLYFGKKNYPLALTYFERAYRADTTFTDALFKTGVCHHYLGDTPAAIATFEKILLTNPSNRDAITNLSIEYRMMGNKEKADYYSKKL